MPLLAELTKGNFLMFAANKLKPESIYKIKCQHSLIK